MVIKFLDTISSVFKKNAMIENTLGVDLSELFAIYRIKQMQLHKILKKMHTYSNNILELK